ncbi:MAG: hypothetical protein ACYDAY_03515 [Candidatus Dormibacteria bacterium]
MSRVPAPPGGRERMELLLIVGVVALVVGGSGAPVEPDNQPAPPPPAASPNPVAVMPRADGQAFDGRLGNDRVAAEAAVLVGRLLFRESGYWETYAQVTPSGLGHVDPTDPASLLDAGRQVTAVRLVMATESSTAVTSLRAGGHDHERTVVGGVAALLATRFPAAEITIQVLFGENHPHANATLQAGAFTYTVTDGL